MTVTFDLKHGDILDCGHRLDRSETDAKGYGPSGYARTPEGLCICYRCAEGAEREDMKTADRFVVYVATQGNAVTSWTGAPLGHILKRWRSGSLNGYPLIHYQIRDLYGADWHGKHGGFWSGGGCALRIRRTKG